MAYAFATLWPASEAFIKPPKTPQMIGDGSDARGLLWAYEIVWDTLKTNPSRLLFGAVYSEMRDAPGGTSLWIPYIERILVVLLHPITNGNTLATAMALALMTLNGLSITWMGRSFKWPWYVTLAVSLAFACNPYTRGRAAVHMGLTGIFYMPLILGAIERLASLPPHSRWPEARQTVLPCAAAFALAAMSAHYYLFVTIICVPMLVLFLYVRTRRDNFGLTKRRLLWIVVASLPAILLVGFSFVMPIPPSLRGRVAAYPDADPAVALQYLHDVGAHAIDYLGGDIKFGLLDTIKARSKITAWIAAHMDYSHPQERANGIRWTYLALAGFATTLALLFRKRVGEGRHSRNLILVLAAFAIYTFLFSLSPRGINAYGEDWGPSLFANKIFPNLRVPSRFGPVVGLCVMMIGAEWIASLARSEEHWLVDLSRALGMFVVFAVVVEYLPLNGMMTAGLRPVRTNLMLSATTCGEGIFVPFQTYDYWAYEETRGTRCALVYPSSEREAAQLEQIAGAGAMNADARFIKTAKCMGVDWLVFRGATSQVTCEALGFSERGPDWCKRTTIEPVKRTLTECSKR